MSRGGIIASIEPESPAERAGLRAGDEIVSADGAPVADVLDWQWYADGVELDVGFVRSADADVVRLTRAVDEPWGIGFAEPLFDAVRTCDNACTFCFMRQLPAGLRPALYVRDDDFRLSFLTGNFITLTNLTDTDVARIVEQRLSPLHVSVHAVEPDVRGELVCAREDRALERFDELVEGGIELHAQIVLVPGVNDGEHLDRTLSWLAQRDGVVSVGVVPLGYTRFQSRFTRSYNDPVDAARVISQVQRWQFAFRERDGVTWVQLADEFYLNASAPFPTAEHYDGFPQYENGIGLVRTFADEAAQLRDELTAAVGRLPMGAESVTVVTGVMAATTLAGALEACEAVGRVRLLAVPNRFFGGNVSVTGLITGADLSSAIFADARARNGAGTYLVPDVVLNDEGLTLDDMTADDVCRLSGAAVRLVSSDAAGLLAGLLEAAGRPTASN